MICFPRPVATVCRAASWFRLASRATTRPSWRRNRAVVSSSTNCQAVLKSAGIADFFDTIVDGVIAEREGLAGKPAPDTFLEGARLLGVAPAQAVVFEDALAGVKAGHDGHFGYVVGVDRVGQATELRDHGADVVVEDLAELLGNG